MDGNNSMVSLPIKAKQDISDLEFGWLEAQTHIVNIVTRSQFFFPFFLLRFDGNTLARPFTPLSISAANIHFPKCGADWELRGWHDPCFLKKENLLDSFSIHKKSDLLDSGPFSCYSIIIKKRCFVLHDLHSFQTSKVSTFVVQRCCFLFLHS